MYPACLSATIAPVPKRVLSSAPSSPIATAATLYCATFSTVPLVATSLRVQARASRRLRDITLPALPLLAACLLMCSNPAPPAHRRRPSGHPATKHAHHVLPERFAPHLPKRTRSCVPPVRRPESQAPIHPLCASLAQRAVMPVMQAQLHAAPALLERIVRRARRSSAAVTSIRSNPRLALTAVCLAWARLFLPLATLHASPKSPQPHQTS